jgi:hypothetical protein
MTAVIADGAANLDFEMQGALLQSYDHKTVYRTRSQAGV